MSGEMMNRRPWTTKEDKLIMDPSKTAGELARKLDRTPGAIHTRRWLLHNPAEKERRRIRGQGDPERRGKDHTAWTEEADKLITAEGRPSDKELARQLNRSVNAIQMRRSRLNQL